MSIEIISLILAGISLGGAVVAAMFWEKHIVFKMLPFSAVFVSGLVFFSLSQKLVGVSGFFQVIGTSILLGCILQFVVWLECKE